MVFRGSRVGAGLSLLACGVSGVFALAGCGSAGPGSSLGTTSSGAPSSPGAVSPSATASALPSWASALGGSVTVVAPHPAAPGRGSPGAALDGFVAAVSSKHYADSCDYVQPSAQSGCRSQVSKVPAGQMPYDKNFALGYVVIGGDKAVVGMTGTFCSPGQSPECFTNNDPAAVFATTKSFGALWANAITPSSGYSLNPCIKIDGKWYYYSSAS